MVEKKKLLGTIWRLVRALRIKTDTVTYQLRYTSFFHNL
jgi:hypothetical protein